MEGQTLANSFSLSFDLVGVIRSDRYMNEAARLKKKIPPPPYPTMVVLGLAYPKRDLPHSKTHLVPSFYTFGKDYHQILHERIDEVMESLPYPYWAGVDNHEHDERLAAYLAGLGFLGKNQLLINEDYGSYIFLAVVFIDVRLDSEYILDVNDDCGDCTICIQACPANALSEQGYEQKKCISHFNQSKRPLTDREITLNHSLFGCDICQLVCPKNKGSHTNKHPEFKLSGKESVAIVDLFKLSNHAFYKKYGDMAYAWRGKTVLMRNALTVLLKQRNTSYNDLIEQSIHTHKATWYTETAKKILRQLKAYKKK